MSASKLVTSEDELNRLLKEKYTDELCPGWTTFDGCFLPEYHANFVDDIEHMEVYDDDVWLCGYPKTGTTWSTEMIWCIANDLDFEGAKVNLFHRFAFLERSSLHDMRGQVKSKANPEPMSEAMLNSVKYLKSLPRPRFIKTHLPFNLLPRQIQTGEKKPKIICVTRNPKDACVSSFHFEKFRNFFRGDFDEFCSLFLAGKLYGAPFWNNVLSYWKERERDNLLLIKYEDMKSDLASVIKKTANFLGKSLEPSGIESLKEHLSFESMKVNPAVNHSKSMENLQKLLQTELKGEFIRAGQVNHGKGTMSDDVIAEFDKWTAKHLESTDFPIDYML